MRLEILKQMRFLYVFSVSGSNSRDKLKIIVIGIKGTLYVNTNSYIQSKLGSDVQEKKRNELFHIRVIMKHTKIDMLFDSVSQVNLISESIVKRLGLNTEPHPKTYPLGWVLKDTQLQVSK